MQKNNLISIEDLLNKMNINKLSIDRACKIYKYLPTQEKISFLEEFNEKKIIDTQDKDELIELDRFISFHLMVIEKYTNIKVEYNIGFFDKLMMNNIITDVVMNIANDYVFLLKFTNVKRLS